MRYHIIATGNIIDEFNKVTVDNQSEGYVYNVHYGKDKVSLTVIEDDKQYMNPEHFKKKEPFLDTLNSVLGKTFYKAVMVSQKEIVVDGHAFKVRLQNAVCPHALSTSVESNDPDCIGFADDSTGIIILDENNDTFGIVPLTIHQSMSVSNKFYKKAYSFTIEAHQDVSKGTLHLTIEGR